MDSIPILRWFDTGHYRNDEARALAIHFRQIAYVITEELPHGPERSVALRKLLESKDAAVRALIEKGDEKP